MYLSWQEHEDPTFNAIKHLIEPSQTVAQYDQVVVADLPEPRAPDSQLRESKLIEPTTLEAGWALGPELTSTSWYRW